LALATVLHSLLFAGFAGAPPRYVGDPGGSKDAISVALVTDTDLRSLAMSRETAPEGVPTRPALPSAAPPPPPAEAAPAQPAPPSQTAAPPPRPAPAPDTAVPETALTLKPVQEPPLISEGEPEPKPKRTDPPKSEPAPPARQAKPDRPRSAMLDLTPPSYLSAPPGGRSAAFARPPGITRSGENDAFARAVVSALQRTMPHLGETRGRVTVRITLGMDGDLVSTQIISPSNVAGLDRSVVFATRQTSYPFPPRNAKAADLVFLITYIYQ
ncbi:MAG: TonB family protein, partial [Hyphomicrobiaceae bacterium]